MPESGIKASYNDATPPLAVLQAQARNKILRMRRQLADIEIALKESAGQPFNERQSFEYLKLWKAVAVTEL
jgi:hypothetical protein